MSHRALHRPKRAEDMRRTIVAHQRHSSTCLCPILPIAGSARLPRELFEPARLECRVPTLLVRREGNCCSSRPLTMLFARAHAHLFMLRIAPLLLPPSHRNTFSQNTVAPGA